MAKQPRTTLDRTIERLNMLEDIQGSIWMEASRNGYTHKWILDQITDRVYTHPDWHRLPQWAKGQIMRAGHTWLKAAQAWRLYNYRIFDGVAYANGWDNFPEALKDICRTESTDSDLQADTKMRTGWLPLIEPFYYHMNQSPADKVKEF